MNRYSLSVNGWGYSAIEPEPSAMSHQPDSKGRLAEKIDATEKKLQALHVEVESIGEPASSDLQHRLEAIDVEEHALQRNFAELQEGKATDEKKLRKIEALLHHIEAEEANLHHEAEFLNQGAPSTLDLAYRIGSRCFDLGANGVKKIIGDHHILWHSPFVNTTIESLSSRFHLSPEDSDGSDLGKN